MTIVFLFTSTISAYAKTAPKIMLNGQLIEFNEVMGIPFVDDKGRTQAPIRSLLESIGAVVNWSQATQSVSVVYQDKNTGAGSYSLLIPVADNKITRTNLNTAQVDIITMDTKPVLKDGRTYLPMRPVFESLGYKVGWEQTSFAVTIAAPNYKEPIDPVVNEEKKEEPIVIPTFYDGRVKNKVTSIKDQGNIGTCWAFASLAAVESALMPNNNYDFSEDHLSLNHGYDPSQEEGGRYMMALAYMASWKGPVLEKQDPYGDKKTIGLGTEPAVYVEEARFYGDKDIEAVKKAVMKYGAVQTHVYSPFLDGKSESLYFNNETSSFFMDGHNGGYIPDANHDVIIVGWDDNYSKGNFSLLPKADGAFIIKNSWGSEYGDQGYYYVSYYDYYIATQNIAFTKVETGKKYDNIYQYDEFGYVNRVGYKYDTAYFSNVFKAKGNEDLSAVSFYAVGANTKYEVFVTDKYENQQSLSKGFKVATGQLTDAGYYTIPFDNPVELNGEGEFAVIVKITTPNEKHPVAIEVNSPENDQLSSAISNPNESFISKDGINWEDTGDKYKANVCLKAFTKNRQEEPVAPEGEQPTDPSQQGEATEGIESTDNTEQQKTPKATQEQGDQQQESPNATSGEGDGATQDKQPGGNDNQNLDEGNKSSSNTKRITKGFFNNPIIDSDLPLNKYYSIYMG